MIALAALASAVAANAAGRGATGDPSRRDADALAATIETRVAAAVGPLLEAKPQPPAVTEFRDRVRVESWGETWPDGAGGEETRPVTGEVWTAAIQAALDRNGAAYLPAREQPYYLDAPLVLRSGGRLVADPRAEIRLKPGTNTCMVRNAGMGAGQKASAAAKVRPDEGIAVEGGIWTTLRTTRHASNGNARGRADTADSVTGAHGVLLFRDVRGLAIRGVTIRQGTPFGVHLAAVEGFLVEDITFEEHGRDGIHLSGHCRNGIIRNLSGVTHDDFVALNAWDWHQYTMLYGPIDHILVERLRGGKEVGGGGVLPDGSAEIRFLPGTKRFPDGDRLACDIENVVVRDTRAIRTVKMYDQPNLETGADRDRADPIGRIRSVTFRGFDTAPTTQPLFQIHADVDGMRVEDVTLRAGQLPPGYALVGIGPQSATYKMKADDPATWVELFSPDTDCTVRNLALTGIRVAPPGAGQQGVPVGDPYSLVGVIEQKPNPDYPRTLPRGGTGKGVWIR